MGMEDASKACGTWCGLAHDAWGKCGAPLRALAPTATRARESVGAMLGASREDMDSR